MPGKNPLSGTNSVIAYRARQGYREPEIYVSSRYGSLAGRLRLARQLRVFRRLHEMTRPNEIILDCPCGMGRLLGTFQSRGLVTIGLDVSEEMLDYASRHTSDAKGVLLRGLAEALPLRSGGVDWSFSFALMKHLPPAQQLQALAELSRVARRGVMVSFAVWNPLSFARWWWNHRRNWAESFPMPDVWVRWMAQGLNLRLAWSSRLVPVLGMETVYLFLKDGPKQHECSS